LSCIELFIFACVFFIFVSIGRVIGRWGRLRNVLNFVGWA